MEKEPFRFNEVTCQLADSASSVMSFAADFLHTGVTSEGSESYDELRELAYAIDKEGKRISCLAISMLKALDRMGQ